MAENVVVQIEANYRDRVSTPLARLRERLEGTKVSVLGVSTSMAALAGATAAVAAAVAAAGAALAAGVVATNRWTEAIRLQSRQTGIAIGNLSALQFAYTQTGAAADDVGEVVRELNLKLGEAAFGEGAAIEAFESVGLDIQQLRRLRPEQLLEEVSEALASVEDRSARTAAASRLLGDDLGLRLLPQLELGRQGLQDYAADAADLGIVLTDAISADSEAFAQSLGRLQALFQGFGVQIASDLFPVFTELINDILPKLQQFFDDITPVVVAFGSAIAGVIRIAADFARSVGRVVAAFTGGNTAVEQMANQVRRYRNTLVSSQGVVSNYAREVNDLSDAFDGSRDELSGLSTTTQDEMDRMVRVIEGTIEPAGSAGERLGAAIVDGVFGAIGLVGTGTGGTPIQRARTGGSATNFLNIPVLSQLDHLDSPLSDYFEYLGRDISRSPFTGREEARDAAARNLNEIEGFDPLGALGSLSAALLFSIPVVGDLAFSLGTAIAPDVNANQRAQQTQERMRELFNIQAGQDVILSANLVNQIGQGIADRREATALINQLQRDLEELAAGGGGIYTAGDFLNSYQEALIGISGSERQGQFSRVRGDFGQTYDPNVIAGLIAQSNNVFPGRHVIPDFPFIGNQAEIQARSGYRNITWDDLIGIDIAGLRSGPDVNLNRYAPDARDVDTRALEEIIGIGIFDDRLQRFQREFEDLSNEGLLGANVTAQIEEARERFLEIINEEAELAVQLLEDGVINEEEFNRVLGDLAALFNQFRPQSVGGFSDDRPIDERLGIGLFDEGIRALQGHLSTTGSRGIFGEDVSEELFAFREQLREQLRAEADELIALLGEGVLPREEFDRIYNSVAELFASLEESVDEIAARLEVGVYDPAITGLSSRLGESVARLNIFGGDEASLLPQYQEQLGNVIAEAEELQGRRDRGEINDEVFITQFNALGDLASALRAFIEQQQQQQEDEVQPIIIQLYRDDGTLIRTVERSIINGELSLGSANAGRPY